MKKLPLILAPLLISANVFASTPNFQNITSGDFKAIVNDFSALSSYSSVSGASGRGNIFGFEVGLLGSLIDTPNVNSVAQKTDSSLSIPMMPNAGLLGAISIPMGLSFEVVLVPKDTFNGLSFHEYGGAVQYRIINFPISLSVKAHYIKTTFDFSENLGGSNASVNFDDSIYGLDLLAGKDLLILEPYVGVGMAYANANLGVTGTSSTIYDSSFTASQTANLKPSSARIFAGVNFNLLIITIGAEYMRTFGTDRFNAKLSAGF